MKNISLPFLVLAISILNLPAFSQTESQAETDSTLLGLPGDNLDLFAVLDLFQKSPSIEDFEKSLNLEESGVNNLDLDLDGKVDFIKVVTEQDGDDFTFVLQVDVSEKEVQDVAVILISKDEDEKITLQMVGDKDLYGNDYVIEPAPPAPKVTANPAYAGPDPVESTSVTTTVVVVESAPVVQYVYSPVYVPYYPPYTYAYHPPYYAAFAVVAVGVYHNNHYYHNNGYHGGYHGNTVVVHNNNTYNNYNNNSRNSSNTVTQHNANGNYNNNRSSASTRPSTTPSTSQSRGSTASPSASQSKPSTASPSTSQSRGSTASPSASQSRPSSSSASRSSSPSRSMSSSPSSSASPSPSRGGGGGRRR
ncbi:MAG: hypothetical protein E4G95_03865 [Bacteroidia bacterium]|nr:MAG: hypothetical protein E4G95_03865 [Bacteroidia bacterium]